jgi:hypothetical protein
VSVAAPCAERLPSSSYKRSQRLGSYTEADTDEETRNMARLSGPGKTKTRSGRQSRGGNTSRNGYRLDDFVIDDDEDDDGDYEP